MSELKLVSPLLDGFAAGAPMSSHHGISCYPAMRSDSNDKYIVKTISIPASQTQLDALLLSGAYASAQDAQDYFKQVTLSLAEEVKLLDKLSHHHGFLAYEGCQVEPLEEGTGFQLYLLSHYRLSLEKFLQRNLMTHLSAVNLGIDMCAALEAARESGFLFVNLKPSNVYRCGEQDYRIGDVGFVEMDSLAYCALPERCVSPYSPPEMTDAFASVGTTADTYALGLVLYQIYNDGKLPFDGQRNLDEELPAPVYADYEMAEIILKACAADPAQRWESPKQMGQALIDYMQRNEVDDTSIVPIAPVIPEFQMPSEELPSDLEEETPPENTEEVPAGTAEAAPEDAAEVPAAPADEPAEEIEDDWIQHVDQLLAEEEDPDGDGYEQVSIASLLALDAEDAEAPQDAPVTEEVADMLSKADELIAHELPAPAVAPEPIEIPMPEPIVLEAEDAEESAPEEAPEEVQEPQPEEESEDEPPVIVPKLKKDRKKLKKALWLLLALFLLAAAVCGGYYYYQEYYLQEVSSMDAVGNDNYVEITVVSEADESLLTLVCTDSYGNKLTSPVVDGKGRFDNLVPDTHYVITLTISGFHKLTGDLECSYGSPSQTNIISFSAIAGAEDGSVILNFTVDGTDTGNWTVTYSADGEDAKTVPCTGHMATLSGLSVGKEYTFTLETDESIYLVGTSELTYTAQKICYAENLTITGYNAGTAQLSWNATEGTSPESWDIHCYHENGGDIYMTVTECTASVEGLDPNYAYTIEVTAAGMTQNTRTYLTANPLVIENFAADTSDPTKVVLTWECDGNVPESGWLLLYTIDDGTAQEVIKTDSCTAEINPAVPGAAYHVSLQTADGTAIFGGTLDVQLTEPGTFVGYGVRASEFNIKLCVTPSKSDWTWRDVDEYTSTFSVGQNASMVLRLYSEYNTSQDDVVTTFVTRDADGNLLFVTSQTQRWVTMWYNGRCELDIPKMPDQPGSYTLDMYFNGAFVQTLSFEIE